ncbi:Fic family protein [Nostoc sp. KVJ20]|nr:Fic family protein [Nostoc sp. KVJ20]
MQTPRFLSISQVLDIHQDEINSFGGTSGVRDEGLLDSALAQP